MADKIVDVATPVVAAIDYTDEVDKKWLASLTLAWHSLLLMVLQLVAVTHRLTIPTSLATNGILTLSAFGTMPSLGKPTKVQGTM